MAPQTHQKFMVEVTKLFKNHRKIYQKIVMNESKLLVVLSISGIAIEGALQLREISIACKLLRTVRPKML